MNPNKPSYLYGKKVLLLAPPFYSLHTQIINELNYLGAKTGFIPDVPQKYNPYFGSLSKSIIKNAIRHLVSFIKRPNYHYLSKYKHEIQKSWDYLICIDGYSFDKSIIDLLIKKNSKITKILYLWDSVNFYNFTPLFKYFDKVYTFDKSDSIRYKITYLPLFWNKIERGQKNKIIYDISFIGSDHTDRIEVLSRIDSFCKTNQLNTFFKIVLDKSKYQEDNHNLNQRNNSERNNNINNSEFLTFKKYSENEVQRIIDESSCILDIVKPNQAGLSNRTIQALASSKKIITTNPSFLGTSLDNGNIVYINRNDPKLDLNFIKQPYISNNKIQQTLEELRIDNWLLTICSTK